MITKYIFNLQNITIFLILIVIFFNQKSHKNSNKIYEHKYIFRIKKIMTIIIYYSLLIPYGHREEIFIGK